MPWEEAPQEPSPPDPGVRGFGVCRAGPRMHHAHWTVNAAEVAVGSSPLLVTVSPGQTCTLCRSSPAVRELLAGEEGPSAAVSAGVSGPPRHLCLPRIPPWGQTAGNQPGLFQTRSHAVPSHSG